MQRSFGRISRYSIAVLSVAVLGLSALGQSLVQDRIVQPVDDSQRITLVGNVHPLANAKYDLGAAPVSQPMNHVELILQRSAAQEAALDNFLASVQNRNSPNYHKWLTPEQFGKLYGPSDDDVAKLTTWLGGKGFTVNEVAPGRTHIDFSGSVGQVQSAFSTSIHSFNANGVQFLANTSNPQIPAAFGPVVAGVAHLNTVPLKPAHVKGFAAKYNPATQRIVPITSTNGLHPNLTEQDEDGNNYLVAVPADVATIYDTPNSKYNASASSSTTYDGTGVIIGIAGQSSIETSIVANYRTLFIGDAKVPTVFNPDNVGDVPGDDTESYLDNELAGSMAPGASLYFYTEPEADGGVFYAAQLAIEANAVDILSISYGDCESDQGNSANAAINASWQQAVAQGITVLVSTGDTGSAGCDVAQDSEGNNITEASGGLAVNGLASTPYNVAVGGTDYDVLANNFGTYVSTPSNGGSASTFYRTAKSYIPEDSWNDSPITNATVAQNVPLASNPNFAANANISGGAGGKSSCIVQTGSGVDGGGGYAPPASCSSGYPKPSWQTGTGVPNDSVRDVPDVSLLAGDGSYAALWAVCDNTSDGQGGTLDCVLATNGDFENDAVGGTSTATPAWASILALARQKTGGRLGQAAQTLYTLFNGSSSATIFHDVTTGNNSVPCTQSTLNAASCLENTAGYFFESGYNTNAGYDLATGIGSVDVTALVNGWSSSSTLITPTLTLTPSATTITTAEALTVAVTVAGPSGSATPTGSVTLTAGTYTSAAATLTSGAASITVPAGTFAAGSYTVQVTYTPDTTSSGVYFSGSASTALTVTQGAAPGFTIAGSAINVLPGASGSTMLSVTPSGGFTGGINLTCSVSGPSGAASVPTCSLSPALVTITGTAAATTTLNIVTTATTTAGTYTVTVNGADVATGKVTGTVPISLSVGVPSISLAAQGVLITLPLATSSTGTVTVTPGGGFTGAVNLTCAITTPAGATCSLSPTPVTISGSAAATSTLTVTIASTTPTGNYTFTVNAADAATGKITASASPVLTVGGTPVTDAITLGSPTAATVSSPGQSGTSTFSVTTNYAPATINFSCVLATAPSGANTSYNPGCTLPAVTVSKAGTAATATATFSTTASTSGALTYPKTQQKTDRWYEAAGGAALACVLFFGIPARRRGWRSMLGLLVFLVTMAGVGCGGGGGNSGGGGSTGTTTGTYTFTVTGTDSVTSSITSTATVTVTVQ